MVTPLNYVPYVKAGGDEVAASTGSAGSPTRRSTSSRASRGSTRATGCRRKFGYDTRRVQFSSLILTGQMTRDGGAGEAARARRYDEATIAQEFEYVATKLGISVAELQGYMDAPKKTYRDYRSQACDLRCGRGASCAPCGLERGRQAMIAIVNYGLGNIQAFANIYKRLEHAGTGRPRRARNWTGVGRDSSCRAWGRSTGPWSDSNASGMRPTLGRLVLEQRVQCSASASACR